MWQWQDERGGGERVWGERRARGGEFGGGKVGVMGGRRELEWEVGRVGVGREAWRSLVIPLPLIPRLKAGGEEPPFRNRTPHKW